MVCVFYTVTRVDFFSRDFFVHARCTHYMLFLTCY